MDIYYPLHTTTFTWQYSPTTEYRTQTCNSTKWPYSPTTEHKTLLVPPYFTWIFHPPPFPVNNTASQHLCNQSIKPHLILLIFLPLLVRHLSKNLKLRPKELSPRGVQFRPKLWRFPCRCPTNVCTSCTLINVHQAAPSVHSSRVLWGSLLGSPTVKTPFSSPV